jgi:arsenite-transporting ATPase
VLLLAKPTRNLFFTGKGGVGKTSLACATAVGLAERGKKVLLVSTDPASNLDEVLGLKLTSQPTPVPKVTGLSALNIDPEAAAHTYRERVVGPYRGVLPDAAVASIEEQLSGACTTEIAAFDEFAKLLGDNGATSSFDHIIFDTAPTGHTLRLLALPAAWSNFLETNTGGTSCLGPLSGLQAQRKLYAATLRALSNAKRTTIVLVSRPDRGALTEAERTRAELAGLGVENQRLVLNGVFTASSDDAIAAALEARGAAALSKMPRALRALPCDEVSLLPFGLVGIPALRAMLDGGKSSNAASPVICHASPACAAEAATARRRPVTLSSLLPLIDEIAASGKGVVMTMGKGGVGKTTVASAIAVELARRGHRVHLSTTDPAAHVDMRLADEVPGLEISRIDPAGETRSYQKEVLATAGKALDKQGRKLLEEDLRSPCTEEIAVFRAFAQKVAAGEDGFVVLDTAPTGHTLLLLDATEAYHRQVSQTMSNLPESVRRLLPRLRDRRFTRVLIVTLPEATPVHEAAQLQQDLARAKIQPFAWVVNQSFAPLEISDPVLRGKAAREQRYIEEVRQKHASRSAVLPWMSTEPVGAEGLQRLARWQPERKDRHPAVAVAGVAVENKSARSFV